VAKLNEILGLYPVPECSVPGLFDSSLVEDGDTLELKGMAPGVHRFQCLIHPWMRTTVTVG
jgi:plastocyanin